MRIAAALFLVLVSATLTGCWSFRKKAKQPLPPLNPPVIVLPVPGTPVDLPPEATTPIKIEPAPPTPEVTIIKPELPPPPEKKPSKAPPKPAAKRPVAAPAPVPSPSVPVQPPPPTTEAPVTQPPQLSELIPDERRAELSREIDQSLERARATLSTASHRTLSRQQEETANRVRTFVRQAEEARSRDISTAVQLARRADLLAQDLAATFK